MPFMRAIHRRKLDWIANKEDGLNRRVLEIEKQDNQERRYMKNV